MLTIREVVAFSLGYLYSCVMAHWLVRFNVDALWRVTRIETAFKRHHWPSTLLGILERGMYTTVLLLNQSVFVAAWLALKSVPQWRRWNETVTGDDGTEIEGRAIYNVFLIGNALNLAFAAAGWKIVEWIRSGNDLLAVTLGIGLVLISLAFLLIAEVNEYVMLKRAIRLWRFLEAYVNIGLFVIVTGLALLGLTGRLDGLAVISLILAVLGGYTAYARPWIGRPRLLVTPDATQWSPSTTPGTSGSLFLRLQVANYGWTPAKNCNGRLNELWTADRQHVRKFDALTLCWTRQDNIHERTAFAPVDIQRSGDYTFLDVAQVTQYPDDIPMRLRVVLPPPMTLPTGAPDSVSPIQGEYLKSGMYYALITIYSDNADSIAKWFEITCPPIESPLIARDAARYGIRAVSRPLFNRATIAKPSTPEETANA